MNTTSTCGCTAAATAVMMIGGDGDAGTRSIYLQRLPSSSRSPAGCHEISQTSDHHPASLTTDPSAAAVFIMNTCLLCLPITCTCLLILVTILSREIEAGLMKKKCPMAEPLPVPPVILPPAFPVPEFGFFVGLFDKFKEKKEKKKKYVKIIKKEKKEVTDSKLKSWYDAYKEEKEFKKMVKLMNQQDKKYSDCDVCSKKKKDKYCDACGEHEEHE